MVQAIYCIDLASLERPHDEYVATVQRDSTPRLPAQGVPNTSRPEGRDPGRPCPARPPAYMGE